jgi:hypothetical protein
MTPYAKRHIEDRSMNEIEFKVPHECSSLQPPVKPPSPLLDEFTQIMQGKEGPLKYQTDHITMRRKQDWQLESFQDANISKFVKPQQGRAMTATFEGHPADKGKSDIELNGIGVDEGGVAGGSAQFDVYTGGLKGSLDMDAMIREGYSARYSHSAITLDTADSNGSQIVRTGVDWSTSKQNGKEQVHASFATQSATSKESVSSETIAATDNTDHKLGVTEYTFNPDGQVTSCSISSTLDGDKADVAIWRMKIE